MSSLPIRFTGEDGPSLTDPPKPTPDPLADIPEEDQKRILAAAKEAGNAAFTSSLGPMMQGDYDLAASAANAVIAREVAAWHAAHPVAEPHVIKDGKANRPGSGLYGRLTGEELQAARETAPETRARAETCNCGHEKVAHADAGHGACTAVLGEDARCVCRGYSRSDAIPETLTREGAPPVKRDPGAVREGYCGIVSESRRAMICTRRPHTDGEHVAEGVRGEVLERWTTPADRVTEEALDADTIAHRIARGWLHDDGAGESDLAQAIEEAIESAAAEVRALRAIIVRANNLLFEVRRHRIGVELLAREFDRVAQRVAAAHDALRYTLGDKDPSGEVGLPMPDREGLAEVVAASAREPHADVEDTQAVCMAAAERAGHFFDPETGRWSTPASRGDIPPEVAIAAEPARHDVGAARTAARRTASTNLHTAGASLILQDIARSCAALTSDDAPARLELAPTALDLLRALGAVITTTTLHEPGKRPQRVTTARLAVDALEILARESHDAEKPIVEPEPPPTILPHILAALRRARDAATFNDSGHFLLEQVRAAVENAAGMLAIGRVDAAIDILSDIEPEEEHAS
jgi:hypothetical protein